MVRLLPKNTSMGEPPPELESASLGLGARAFFFGLEYNDRSITKKEISSSIISRLMEQIDRCAGVKLVASGEILITCYRCGRKQRKSASIKRREKFIH